MIYQIMTHLSTNDQLNLIRAYPMYEEPIWHDKRMWYHVKIDSKHLHPTVFYCLHRHRRLIHKFTCSSKMQERLTMPINRVIKEFTNLTHLDFAGSRLLYELDILQFLPKIVHLNVSNCQSLSTYSLIKGLKHLRNLQVFLCNDNYVCISAYSVYDAVRTIDSLRFISCVNSGTMQPWIVRNIFEECPKLVKFFFSTYFALATEKGMYEWFQIMRFTHPHVEFTHCVMQEIASYECSCEKAKEELKKKKQQSS